LLADKKADRCSQLSWQIKQRPSNPSLAKRLGVLVWKTKQNRAKTPEYSGTSTRILAALHAADLLDHARDQGSTLERALEDFQGEKELLVEIGDLVLSRAYDIDVQVT